MQDHINKPESSNTSKRIEHNNGIKQDLKHQHQHQQQQQQQQQQQSITNANTNRNININAKPKTSINNANMVDMVINKSIFNQSNNHLSDSQKVNRNRRRCFAVILALTVVLFMVSTIALTVDGIQTNISYDKDNQTPSLQQQQQPNNQSEIQQKSIVITVPYRNNATIIHNNIQQSTQNSDNIQAINTNTNISTSNSSNHSINTNTNTNTNSINNDYVLTLSEQPGLITNIWKLGNQFKQLSFCLIIDIDIDIGIEADNNTNTNINTKINYTTSPSPSNHNHSRYQQILSSIYNQINHTNYKILNKINIQNNNNNNNNNTKSLLSYIPLIAQNCPSNSIIMFINNTIPNNLLYLLNLEHQRNNAWVTYTATDQINQKKKVNKGQAVFRVISFYFRIYQLLRNNDFDQTNAKYFQQRNYQIFGTAILELCALHAKKIKQTLVSSSYLPFSPIQISFSNIPSYSPPRTPYTLLYKLSQDYPINARRQYQTYQNIHKLKIQAFNDLSPQKMAKAIQRQQLLYLPANHSIAEIQQIEYEAKFGDLVSKINTKINTEFGKPLNKDMTINSSQQQQHQYELPFCVTVLSHNNIAQNRYIKLFLSIHQQKYSNYHIVFIDDWSHDGNLEKSMQYVKTLNKFNAKHENINNNNLNQNKNKDKRQGVRITWVKNNKRMFATYNIINAAFNFCQPHDIQLLIDGDDELIGYNVFKSINALYLKGMHFNGTTSASISNNQSSIISTSGSSPLLLDPSVLDSTKWIIYTNFKTSLYTYGTSQSFNTLRYVLNNNKRQRNHIIGAIRTWRVELLFHIPLKYHQNQSKSWLDTVYDDALQHSIAELCGSVEKIEYYSEMLYEYNKGYGENDDATLDKRKHRRETYEWMLQLEPLSRLKDGRLHGSERDAEVLTVLQSDRKAGHFQVVGNR